MDNLKRQISSLREINCVLEKPFINMRQFRNREEPGTIREQNPGILFDHRHDVTRR